MGLNLLHSIFKSFILFHYPSVRTCYWCLHRPTGSLSFPAAQRRLQAGFSWWLLWGWQNEGPRRLSELELNPGQTGRNKRNQKSRIRCCWWNGKLLLEMLGDIVALFGIISKSLFIDLYDFAVFRDCRFSFRWEILPSYVDNFKIYCYERWLPLDFQLEWDFEADLLSYLYLGYFHIYLIIGNCYFEY